MCFGHILNVDYSMKRQQGDISNYFTKKKISRQSAVDQQECESSQAECSQAANTGQHLKGQTSPHVSPGENADIREML